ncbi:MAG TPA: hypothetical protein VFL93_12635 [Longimicrobiaceae bacterium]|nr:hypothetical protein [Longimicrobiaceae bacterium]
MILNCSFEELQALVSGAELLLHDFGGGTGGSIAAPSEAKAAVEALRPRLHGPLSIQTLAEQQSLRRAVGAICEELHDRLEEKVLQFHPAHEEAVSLYFDYAHAFGVLSRLDEMGVEMRAMIELMTGAPASPASAAEINFPD